jgi:hypothetical protein
MGGEYRVPVIEASYNPQLKMAHQWPVYKPGNDAQWLYLKGDNVSAIAAQKRDVCAMWQSVKRIERSLYGKLRLDICTVHS